HRPARHHRRARVARAKTRVCVVPTAQVNGIAVYYEQHGAGTPLLLIGGLGADLTLFANVTRSFADHHQVVTFDNRGAARTDNPDEPYSIELMAQDTVGLLD